VRITPAPFSVGVPHSRPDVPSRVETGLVPSRPGTLRNHNISGYAAKSLFRNIFHISPLNSKIFREFLPNPMILIDRGNENNLFPKVERLLPNVPPRVQ
jgi:hypothetical protein